MSEEKRNRLLAALAVNVVLLVAILFAVAVYQFVQIGILGSRKAHLETQLETYEQLIEEGSQTLEDLENGTNGADALFEAILFYGNTNGYSND